MRLGLWRELAERRNALIPPAPRSHDEVDAGQVQDVPESPAFSHLEKLNWREGGVRSIDIWVLTGKDFSKQTLSRRRGERPLNAVHGIAALVPPCTSGARASATRG